MKIKALVIEPKNDIYFKEIDINKFEDSDVKIKWTVSSVCNSERRRFNLTKSATNKDPFIGGHEAVGTIETEKYISRKYALLPHSNCLTRGEKDKCNVCGEGKENLCSKMRHAGLDKNTPSGFTDKMFVSRSQLFDVTEIKPDIAPFLEPFSCVLRSWKLANTDISKGSVSLAIIGGGPIGCLHAFYVCRENKSNQITIVESCPERRKVLNNVFDNFLNISISDNTINDHFDITVMASSDTSAYDESFRLLRDDGHLILFSGFNDPLFNDGSYNPEIVHRHEFIHFSKTKKLVGSSGYNSEDLIDAKRILVDFDNISNIVTGKVYGLDSKTIHRYDGVITTYDEPVLIKDIKGDLKDHIKIQYFNNNFKI
jgi:threonine dehydrogenase-like Zn-dependent dehydrogenase